MVYFFKKLYNISIIFINIFVFHILTIVGLELNQ